MSSQPPPEELRPLDALWRPVALAWIVAAGEGLAAVIALAPGLAEDRWLYFAVASFSIQWVALSTLGVLYVARRSLAALSPVAVGAVALVAALVLVWLLTWVASLYYGSNSTPTGFDWTRHALLSSGITLVVGLLGLAIFADHWRGRIHESRARTLQTETQQAQLQALQARIRPHFLFNTLNTGAALVHARPEQAERLLLDLADLFRAALTSGRDIPLADELALSRRYLEIEALRFGDRLTVGWHVPDALPDVRVPALSIQPLVENAIRHGVEPAAAGGAVDVSVDVTGDGIRIAVSNELPPGGRSPAPGHQVGLASARERIGALSGGRGRLETKIDGTRYVATITLPAAKAPD